MVVFAQALKAFGETDSARERRLERITDFLARLNTLHGDGADVCVFALSEASGEVNLLENGRVVASWGRDDPNIERHIAALVQPPSTA
jgi:hypothetical protein